MCSNQPLVLIRLQALLDECLPVGPSLDQLALRLRKQLLTILELSRQALILLLLGKKVLSVLLRLALPRLGLLEDGLEVSIGLKQSILS